MNILVVRLSALGDVAMTIPAIYSLAEQYPDLTVKVLTLRSFAQLFIGCPDNIRLLSVTKQEIHGIKGLVRLLSRLGKEDIDMVADLHNVLRSWLIGIYFRMRGKRVVMVDKARKKRLRLLRQRKGQQVAFTERYFNVFRSLGFALEPSFSSVLTYDCAKTDFSAVLTSKGMKVIGIAPYARYQNKTYPLAQMEQVIARLSASGQYHILLFSGGRAESEQMRAWESKYDHVVSVAGHYPLADEVRLMACLDVMVSMDSANMHLASLVGTPVVSLWGSTTPLCGFMGWRQKDEDAILLHCDCQPCTIAGSNHCSRGDFHCLADIQSDTVVAKIMSITKPS